MFDDTLRIDQPCAKCESIWKNRSCIKHLKNRQRQPSCLGHAALGLARVVKWSIRYGLEELKTNSAAGCEMCGIILAEETRQEGRDHQPDPDAVTVRFEMEYNEHVANSFRVSLAADAEPPRVREKTSVRNTCKSHSSNLNLRDPIPSG